MKHVVVPVRRSCCLNVPHCMNSKSLNIIEFGDFFCLNRNGDVQLENRKGREETRRGDRKDERRQGAGRQCESAFMRSRWRESIAEMWPSAWYVARNKPWAFGRHCQTVPISARRSCRQGYSTQGRIAPAVKGLEQL